MIKSLEEFIAEQEHALDIHKLKLRIAALLPAGCKAVNIAGFGTTTQRVSVHYTEKELSDALLLCEKMEGLAIPYAEYRGGYTVSVLPYPGIDSRGKELREDDVQCVFSDSNPYLEVEGIGGGSFINTLTFFVAVNTIQSSHAVKTTSINVKVCIQLAYAVVRVRKVPVCGNSARKPQPKRNEYYPNPHQDRTINWYAGGPESESVRASLFWGTDSSFTAAMTSLLSSAFRG